MKILKFLYISLLLLTVGCNSDDDANTDSKKDIFEYTFSTNSQIKTSEENGFVLAEDINGDNLVFTYSFEKYFDPGIEDGFYSEKIIFEIPADAENFSFVDEDLVNSSIYYSQSCFCPRIGSLPSTKGSLTGKKISKNKWEVSIDVVFPVEDREIKKTIKADFVLK